MKLELYSILIGTITFHFNVFEKCVHEDKSTQKKNYLVSHSLYISIILNKTA